MGKNCLSFACEYTLLVWHSYPIACVTYSTTKIGANENDLYKLDDVFGNHCKKMIFFFYDFNFVEKATLLSAAMMSLKKNHDYI